MIINIFSYAATFALIGAALAIMLLSCVAVLELAYAICKIAKKGLIKMKAAVRYKKAQWLFNRAQKRKQP